MQLTFEGLTAPAVRGSQEKNGAVYTQPWVVDLILDLVGYVESNDLAASIAVEPAAGDGAFLVPMARRLVASCKRHERDISEAAKALRAYELDHASAECARKSVITALEEDGVQLEVAKILVHEWVITGDYLLNWPQTPAADYVIGNPPYIRLEDVPPATARQYRTLYPTMTGRADIYVGFFEAALRHLKPDGVCGFICADRWMLNQYGSMLRRFITSQFSVEAVIEMHRADAFHAQVSAYPAVTVIRKTAQSSVLVASAGPDARSDTHLAFALREAADSAGAVAAPRGFRATRVENWFRGDNPWPCVSPDRLALLKRLETEFDPLEHPLTRTRVSIGVATGADDVFVTKDPQLVEPSRMLPLAMAADTRGGDLRWSGHYLVDPWEADGRLVDLTAYPRLGAYFEQHRHLLSQRHIAVRRPHAWYRTIDRVHHSAVGQKKLYLPDIKGIIHPVLDAGKTYPHHNLYVVQSDGWDLEVLGGILLSSISQFFVECYAVRMRGGWLRFQAQYLRRIRIPLPSAVPQGIQGELRLAFRARDVPRADAALFPLYGIKEIPREDEFGS